MTRQGWLLNSGFLNYKQDLIKQSKISQSSDAYSVFKKKSDDMGWKKTLPAFIENAIKEDEEFNTLNKIFKWS
jgi:hypothetical protein